MEKALQGVRVLDLTRVLAGPYASMILGDLGAEVIKIENPDGGDDSRGYGPFANGESVYFISLNRNKKSLSLNLKSPEGREIFLSLVRKSDIVLENFRPGTMEKLGLGYADLEKTNPGIIYAACSGFGHTGPYRQKAAYDLIVQGMGGIMSLTGFPDGPPVRVGASIADITAGLFTATGILAALHSREKTGRGQKVDVAMLDCQVAILENAIARFSVTGKTPRPTGNRHPSITPFAVFQASDGCVVVAAGNDKLWQNWSRTVGREDLARDPRFQTNAGRTDNWDALEGIMAEVMRDRSVAAWLDLFEKAGIPSGPINDIGKVLEHPQVLAREMVVSQDHPVAGPVMVPGIPVKLSRTPGAVETPAPLLGEHNRAVLKELGFKEAEIERLKEKGAI